MSLPPAHPVVARVGLVLALIQLFFTFTWTVYVIFLPQLAAQVGLDKQAVLVILMVDQLIFLIADTAMGVAADKSAQVFGRLARWVVLLTLVSCLAFLLLPFVAASGPAALAWFWLLTVIWSVTSSALRAPPMVLLGKYAALASLPRLASLSFLGLGMAGALAPYLTVTLRGLNPRWPFALSSIALALATLGIVWAERTLKTARVSIQKPSAADQAQAAQKPPVAPFLVAIALLGIGFQIHFSLNTAPAYLRFAKPEDLELLMPLFWVGFNVMLLANSRLTARFGSVWVMSTAACVGALATYLSTVAGSLNLVIATQLIAGGAWGLLMTGAFTTALVVGRTGREGWVTGSLFSLLALATLARMALVASQLNKDSVVGPALAWLPSAVWAAAGVLLLGLAWQIKRDETRRGMLLNK
jgi:Na+/melibiose symporter-like transporter